MKIGDIAVQQNLIRISKLVDDSAGFLNAMGQHIFDMMKILRPFKGVKRAKLLFKIADQAIGIDLTKNPEPTCKIGCSHCCYMNVDVFEDEAIYLAQKIKKGEITYNEEEFEHQKSLDADGLWGDPRPCIFLKDSKCSIYEDRPVGCRKYFVVVDDPEKTCKMSPYVDREVGTLAMVNAEIVYSALANISPMGENSSLAFMLDKALKGGFRK